MAGCGAACCRRGSSATCGSSPPRLDARLRLRGRIGEDDVGLAVDGLEARRLVLRRLRHLLGQVENVVGLEAAYRGRRAWHRYRAGPSPVTAVAADGCGAAAGGDGGIGLRGGMAAGRGGAAGGGGAGFAAAGVAVSSSAMIRRMEARISSIDGSCAFAGWLIAESLQTHPYKSMRDAG
jgi:hypothetical protein